MKSLCIAIIALSMIHTAVAADDEFTGNDLQILCAQEGGNPLACNAYIRGFADGATAQHAPGYQICFPKSATGLQARAVVEKYMLDHPENLHHQAGMIGSAALAAAFPCRKAN